MEYRKEVEGRIGAESYRLLLAHVEDGRIDHSTMQAIGTRMSRRVNGVYKEKTRQGLEPRRIFQFMLDCFYKDTLYDPKVDTHNRIVNILEEEGPDLAPLVDAMKKANEKASRYSIKYAITKLK